MTMRDELPFDAQALKHRHVTVLGSTGSIGSNTVDVLLQARRQGWTGEVEALIAGRQIDKLAAQAKQVKPRLVVTSEPDLYFALKESLAGSNIEIAAGPQAIMDAVARPVDWTMAAIVGAAGLRPTLRALENGGTIGLANKECIVCAGDLMVSTARKFGAKLLPVDSEHSAIFQSLTHPRAAERLCLTASGGPFRTRSLDEMARMTPEQAIAHPNWSMGAKISVDSATMMNKGLELIEAAILFDFPESQIDILVHPQSIIHSYVQYIDGSIIAQLGTPDMRTPIAYAFAWPDRIQILAPRLDLAQIATLTFEAPDPKRFPALTLARNALREGGSAMACLNAANEVAVQAFLDRRIGFLDISRVAEHGLEVALKSANRGDNRGPLGLDQVLAADNEARRMAVEHIGTLSAMN